MTARDWLPAHLVPPGELHGDFGRLTFGTPPSPETRLPRTDEAMAREADAGSGRREPNTAEAKAKPGWEASGPRQPPARAMIRQAGVYGAELHAREGDVTIILPLDEDQLLGLVDEAMSGLRRARAGRRNRERTSWTSTTQGTTPRPSSEARSPAAAPSSSPTWSPS